ncbi:hypothetical protein Tco_1001510 [Tanacetum coccineum]
MDRKKNHNLFIRDTKLKLGDIDKKLDCGEASEELLLFQMNLMQSLHERKSVDAHDILQKAKVKLAIEGDENTKFFHEEAFCNHFASSFHQPSSGCSRINFTFPNRLSQEQIKDLEDYVSTDEIRKAVWECGENKSPDPDGYTFEFYRKFWYLVGPDFCKAIQWFFYHSNFLRGCNSSFVALIPKVPDAKLVSDFRPISLLGSMYKVITKILANRLSSVISDLVSDVQRVVEAGMYKGIVIDNSVMISRLFYADDAVFVVRAWEDTLCKLKSRLSKWKAKTLSIGGRLTLLKAVLGATPIYDMSLYRVPKTVLNMMESLRSKFFNGSDGGDKKITWIKWTKVLAAKKNGGLGVSSFFALNRDLLFRLLTVLLAEKCHPNTLDQTFRRNIRGGVESHQYMQLQDLIGVVSLSNSTDRWVWDLNGNGDFMVKESRSMIEILCYLRESDDTCWIMYSDN